MSTTLPTFLSLSLSSSSSSWRTILMLAFQLSIVLTATTSKTAAFAFAFQSRSTPSPPVCHWTQITFHPLGRECPRAQVGLGGQCRTNGRSEVRPSVRAKSYVPLWMFGAMDEGGSDEGGGGASLPGVPPSPTRTREEDEAIQWDLFLRHHARGSWRGTWTSYDYMGDVVDSTVASVDLVPKDGTDPQSVLHTHTIVTSAATSDCETCFDSTVTKTIPVASYDPTTLGRRIRLASCGMVVGPSLLRSGSISTELALRYGNGRVRVVFRHAPVWERGIEPGSCPPQGLKLFQTLVSREVLDAPSPPTPETERAHPPQKGDPKFFRPVPPFAWHKRWGGTSWTWGPSSGDRGWLVQDVDEADAWHGRPTGDHMGVWSMRLAGGVLVQCPRVVVGGEAGLCRLAWLPQDDDVEEGGGGGGKGGGGGGDNGAADQDGIDSTSSSSAKLLRIEASILALEPIISEDDDDMMIGFHPPSLGSLRCDTFSKIGELENASMLTKLMELDAGGGTGGIGIGSGLEGVVKPRIEKQEEKSVGGSGSGGNVSIPKPSPSAKDAVSRKSGDKSGNMGASDDNDSGGDKDSGLDAIRKAIKM